MQSIRFSENRRGKNYCCAEKVQTNTVGLASKLLGFNMGSILGDVFCSLKLLNVQWSGIRLYARNDGQTCFGVPGAGLFKEEVYIYMETPACSWPSLRPVLGRDTFWPLAPALGSQPDAFYDRGITFPINCFLNNGAPSPKIVGMPILFRKRRLSFARAMGLLIQMQLDVC